MKEKIHVVSFSGGRTSAYLTWLIEQKRINEGIKTHYVFMDTGMEHPKTYEFIRNVANNFNIRISCLRLKVNPILGKGNDYTQVSLNDICCDFKPWNDMILKYSTPTFKMPFCTARMKSEIFKKYCDKWFGKYNYYTWIGIRSDESHRIKDGDSSIKYLASISNFYKKDILNWWSNKSFDLDLPEYLGNCIFCVKKGLNRIALAAKCEPELAEQFNKTVIDKHVRILPNKTHPNEIMFRQYNSLQDIINLYKNVSKEHLINSLHISKVKTESCEESCEVFTNDEISL